MPARPTPRHLVIIGAQRSGTTYLAGLLAEHPGVAVAQPVRPEPKAFLSDAVLEGGRPRYVARWFGNAGSDATLLVEKSTSYLEHPSAVARIRAVLGEPLLLAQLRDPVARAVSNWRFSTDHGVEDWPLVDALRADLDAARGEAPERHWDARRFSVSPYRYLRRGRYAEQLAPWRAAFGGRLLVTFYEELMGSAGEFERLWGPLGLPPEPLRTTGAPVNASEAAAPPLPPRLEHELRAWFAPADLALADMLGRTVPWQGGADG